MSVNNMTILSQRALLVSNLKDKFTWHIALCTGVSSLNVHNEVYGMSVYKLILGCAVGGVIGCMPFLAIAGSDTLQLTIRGEVVSQPCVVKPGDEDIMVDMSTITDADLARDKRSPTKKFTIHLEKCNASVAKTVKVTFSGVTPSGDNSVLALSPSSEAKGIAIGLEEKGGTALPLNKPSSPVNILDGDTKLEFGTYVKLLSLSDLEPGKFAATANFTLDYE